jgi:hypothetical protein
MGKAERSRNLARRERIAAQQAAAQRAERRRRMLIASGSVAVVLVLVVAILVLKLSQAPAKAGPAASDPALAGLVTDVPPATFDTVGKGTSAGLQAISGQRLLTRDGSPLPGRGVLPVLRGRALGAGRGAEPVRHLLQSALHSLLPR